MNKVYTGAFKILNTITCLMSSPTQGLGNQHSLASGQNPVHHSSNLTLIFKAVIK